MSVTHLFTLRAFVKLIYLFCYQVSFSPSYLFFVL
uniref:Uncharacterized protein n=1 Tax=Rhizophora mucronata TaxID=61149 RepID=A0A2P2PCA2_RHIMU